MSTKREAKLSVATLSLHRHWTTMQSVTVFLAFTSLCLVSNANFNFFGTFVKKRYDNINLILYHATFYLNRSL